jgi:mono/diheme cytochrome c family protein
MAMALQAACRQPQAEVKPDSGDEIYMTRCALCHNSNAEGIPPAYPPLAGTEWVDGPPERLGAIILDGMTGRSGTYNGVMPGWRNVLTDAQIAALMTWLRKGDGKPPVTPVQAGHIRLETQARNSFWTVSELHALRMR